MILKHSKRLQEILRSPALNKEMVELLELYAILLIDKSDFDSLLGVRSFKEFLEGAIEARELGGVEE